MKIIKSALFIIVSSLLIFSCANQSNNDKNKEDHSSNSSKTTTESLALNNGEKWIVNEEMKPHIQESEKLLEEYLKNNSTDYKTLSAQLKKQNSALIKSCTMQGESHDELHKWLQPHMELIEALGKAQNVDEANVIVSKLEKSFETYKQHFQ